MGYRMIEKQMLLEYQKNLQQEEKSEATIEKYIHDLEGFFHFAHGKPITKELVVDYKGKLSSIYAPRSVNARLASVNGLLSFLGWTECRVKSLKLQQQVYIPEDRELTKDEYFRLLAAAKDPRLHLILETICSTGIRISELEYFTVEAVRTGTVVVRCKNKTRSIFIPQKLKRYLLEYAKRKHRSSGIIFCTKNGKALSRCNIWRQMKQLCAAAKVNAQKVFPHNLRKLFARTFYKCEKDIAKLADILGHSSINTTRIYIITTGAEHRRKIEKMGLVV